MKHYEKLISAGCFSKSDLVKITGSEAAAKWLCMEYQNKGYIERVKHDLYAVISLETGQPVSNRFVIATHISDDAVVSYHSAFEFYGYANQVFHEVQVTTGTRFRDFEYNGLLYRRFSPRVKGNTVKINGARVTSLERTVIDCINLFEKVCGLEELLRCLSLIPFLNESELILCLREYDSFFLYQKTGYILSYFAHDMGLTDRFFDVCSCNLPKGKTYLSAVRKDYFWNNDWRMYVPEDLMNLLEKGTVKNADI